MRILLPLLPALFAAVVFAGCDVVGGEEAEPTASLTGESPGLQGPASRYAPFVEELSGDFEVNPPETFALTDDIWSRLGPFESGNAGEQFIDEHGFTGGYRVLFNPDGLLAGVASDGSYYVTVETYLFEGPAGATATFDAYRDQASAREGSESVTTDRVGNRSGAWQYVEGTVGDTDMTGIYHRFIFQRGNLFALVQTYGAEEHVTIDAAREIAALIDARALGEIEAAEPTPIQPVLPTREPDQQE